jgi:hypothetical protein
VRARGESPLVRALSYFSGNLLLTGHGVLWVPNMAHSPLVHRRTEGHRLGARLCAPQTERAEHAARLGGPPHTTTSTFLGQERPTPSVCFPTASSSQTWLSALQRTRTRATPNSARVSHSIIIPARKSLLDGVPQGSIQQGVPCGRVESTCAPQLCTGMHAGPGDVVPNI